MGKIKGDSMLKTQISKKYKIVALNLADTLHKYPDEFWELLSDFYYHHEMAEILSAPFDDPRKDFIDESMLRDIKGTQSIEHFHVEHLKKADEFFKQIEKKWSDVTSEGGLYTAIYHSNIKNKLDKWMKSPKVFNPIGEPKVKYLEF